MLSFTNSNSGNRIASRNSFGARPKRVQRRRSVTNVTTNFNPDPQLQRIELKPAVEAPLSAEQEADRARRCRSIITTNLLTKAFYRRPSLVTQNEEKLKKLQPSFSVLNATRIISRVRKLRNQAAKRLEIFQVFAELEKQHAAVDKWSLQFKDPAVEGFHEILDQNNFVRRTRVLLLLALFVFGPVTAFNATLGNNNVVFGVYGILLPIWLVAFYAFRKTGRTAKLSKHFMISIMYMAYTIALIPTNFTTSFNTGFPFQLAILLYSLVPLKYGFRPNLCLSLMMMVLYFSISAILINNSSENTDLLVHAAIFFQIVIVSAIGSYARELHQRRCTAEMYVTGALACKERKRDNNETTLQNELMAVVAKYSKFDTVYKSLSISDQRPASKTLDSIIAKRLKSIIRFGRNSIHPKADTVVVPMHDSKPNCDIAASSRFDMRFADELEGTFVCNQTQKCIDNFRKMFFILLITQAASGFINSSYKQPYVLYIRYFIQLPAWIIGISVSFDASFHQVMKRVHLSLLTLNIMCFMALNKAAEVTNNGEDAVSSFSTYTGYLVMAYMLLFSSKIELVTSASVAVVLLLIYVTMHIVFSSSGSMPSSCYYLNLSSSFLLAIALGSVSSRDQERAERLDFMLRHSRAKRVSNIQKASKLL